ncbi:MAG: ribosome assembly cofactor RimP [Mariprofundaceae bacterium]|nr:ribosome assembly cofactor RimP [Mariprofundaceae bacterium]
MESKVLELLTPIADELGVDVLRVRISGSGNSQLVQVLVDRKGGVDSDTLARISRGLALQLDVEDLIKGKYRLELSSPGFEWPLESAADFDRYESDWIKVIFKEELDLGEPIEGDNLGPENEGFLIQEEGMEPRHIAMADVKKVVRAVNWKKLNKKG